MIKKFFIFYLIILPVTLNSVEYVPKLTPEEWYNKYVKKLDLETQKIFALYAKSKSKSTNSENIHKSMGNEEWEKFNNLLSENSDLQTALKIACALDRLTINELKKYKTNFNIVNPLGYIRQNWQIRYKILIKNLYNQFIDELKNKITYEFDKKTDIKSDLNNFLEKFFKLNLEKREIFINVILKYFHNILDTKVLEKIFIMNELKNSID